MATNSRLFLVFERLDIKVPSGAILVLILQGEAAKNGGRRIAVRKAGHGIDIGRRSLAFPVTPPCVRVRTRRFGRIKRRVCSARKEAPSDRNKRLAWHRREPVFG